MTTLTAAPFETFESAHQAMFVVRGNGEISHINRAGRAWLARLDAPVPGSIGELVGEREARTILGTELFSLCETRLPREAKFPTTLLTIDVSGSEPGEDRLLLSAIPGPSPGSELAAERDMLSTISHDLKNPLGAIFGYADAVLDTRAGEGLLPAHREVITKIRATASRAIELVRNYQFLSRDERGPARSSAAAIDLTAVVQSVIEYTWRDEAFSPALRLEWSKDPLPVRIERLQLERIASNLLTNAGKYTPPDGTVTVSTRRENDFAVFTVHNSAPAIPRDELPEVFSRFHRSVASSSGVKGTGLGLYITKTIVEASRGQITVESSPEQGTTFRVFLPLDQQSSQPR